MEQRIISKFVAFFLVLVFHGSAVLSQEFRFKFFLIPILDHSVAGEVLVGRRLGFQLAYQNHIEPGDNRYFHHRIMPSVRYYMLSEKRFLDRFYAELFHRSAFIRQIPDQDPEPYYDYSTQSLGFAVGKQFLFRRNFLMDFSLGRYRLYAGDAKDDHSDFDFLNPYGARDRWRIDVKLGWILGGKAKGPRSSSGGLP